MGLRAQILLSLIVVTVGAIASVGAIAIWQTRQEVSAERIDQAARKAELASRLVADAAGESGSVDDADARARVTRMLPEIAGALGVDELRLYDSHGAPLGPGATFESDGRGVAAALAGVPPHAEDRSTSTPGGPLTLVAYAALGSSPARGVVRCTFALDRGVDALLSRARASVVLLGALDGLILLVVAAWILRGAVMRPVAALEKAAQRVAAGDLEARVEVRGPGELGRLADAFERMTRSLSASRESLIRSEKLAGIGRLAAGVAHEVGNPLAAILGYVEVLRGESEARPIEPSLRADVLERVRAEIERIHHIIQELLEYARPPRAEALATEVAPSVEAALSLVRAQARLRGVSVRVELDPDLPAVRATAERLTQVLLNLLLNAADATGGAGTVTIAARRDGERVVVSVSDDGPGVAAADAAHIFDPFFSTKDVGRGTGLGLSVSLAIVESYGGTLRLAATPTGARFEVVLLAQPLSGTASA